MMTKAQINAVTCIQRDRFNDVWTDDKYELKRFTVEEVGRGKIMVAVTFGMRGDENTPAMVMRYRGLFLVGRRGGIKALTARHGDKQRARRHPLIYGWS